MRPLQEARERHIFSERPEMLLVVALRRQSSSADDLDRIEVAGRPSVLAPRRAGDQRRAGPKKVNDLGEGLWVAGENKGKGRLRPDQMRHVSNPGSIRRRCPFRQVEITTQDRLLAIRVKRSVVLTDVGLDQAQFD